MSDNTPNFDVPRTALVTGAAGALGIGITARLLEAGHRVVMVDLNGDQLSRASQQFPNQRVLTLQMDITSSDAPKAIDAAIREIWEPVSILVNNAGVSPKHDGKAAGVEKVTVEEWRFVMAVNVEAPMRLAQRFLAYMREQKWGRVVNISSRAGRSNTYQAGAAYATSKAAILGLTRSIASEYAPYGVTANTVAPGLVESQLTSRVAPELLAKIRERTPLLRAGTREEVGSVVAFLASQNAGYITGACLDVNGGAFMC